MNTGKRKVCWILSAFLGTLLLLAAISAYSQYVTLKQTLLLRISDKATSLIDQKTEISDISLSAAGITIHDISIGNPEGFGPGQLLRIRKVRLVMRYRELFRGRLSFRSINVESPELSLMTDSSRRLNMSEKLKAFLSKKGTVQYQIDEVAITQGGLSFNSYPLATIRDITVTLRNLSSDSGIQSFLEASVIVAGESKATMKGWAFLKDTPRKFSASLSSESIDLSPLKEKLGPFGMDLGSHTGNILINTEGDTDRGAKVFADIRLKNTGSLLFSKRVKEISLSADVFFDAAADSLLFNRVILAAGDVPVMQMQGTIHDLQRSPSYLAEMRINRLDLATFNIMKGLKAGGTVSSGVIQAKGRSFSSLPEISGAVTLSDGTLETDKTEIQQGQVSVVFTSGTQMSARMQASGRIVKAGPYVLRRPVDIKIAAAAKGKPDHVTLSSTVMLSETAVEVQGNDAAFRGANASFDGVIAGQAIAGSAAVAVKEPSYGMYRGNDLKAILDLNYDGTKAVIRDLHIESEMLNVAADSILITLPQASGRTGMEARNLSASYPGEKAELKGLDCSISLLSGKSGFSGDGSFTVGKVVFQDISAGPIAGSGSIDHSGFSLTMPSADIFHGTVKLALAGRTPEGPFPVSLDIRADRVDLDQISRAVRLFSDTPYRASGSINQLLFKGTVQASDNIIGNASISGMNVTLKDVDKRGLLKDAVLNADAVFRGPDAEIKAHVSIGSLAASLAGTISGFSGQDRSLRISLLMPEAKASDIRSAFWDIVPDRLLYVGLEGGLAIELFASYDRDSLAVDGSVLLRDIMFEGENNEYAAGPITGMVPIHFSSSGKAGAMMLLPSFERTDFEELRKTYTGAKQSIGNEVRIKSVRYGFRLLEDVSLWLEQKGRALNVNRFSAKMFGGNVYGTAQLTIADGLSYQAGLLLDSVSLTRLCEDITPIKGYISGKVNGIALIKGGGAGLEKMIGKADFWTFSDRQEEMRLSREFLQEIGGPQIRAYLGDRRFDKGVMGLYIQNGFLVFRELEISNRNLLGITDLSVKVAPLNNRIAIDHFLWTVVEAAQRAKKD